MGRRERPKVSGTDPAYSHAFLKERPKLPNGMPPSVKIPGLNDGGAQAGPSTEEEKPKAGPAPVPDAADLAAKVAEPEVEPTPEAKTEAKRPAAKPSKRVKAKRPADDAAPPKESVTANASSGEKRKVSLKVSMTTAHVEAMKPLVAAGLAQRDVLALAGRRTMKRFEPSPDFVPVPDGDRVPMTVAYSTTKYVSGRMLDDMRDEHDPLRVKSDAAMIRGQFETLFWSVLDDVIAELRQQRG
ncbi:hypothetical protein [Jannaschia sp. LMIT008]|uniref:hypothetical protein n=1 Tax=Jannaschia maritima TaxID=3032585 RepID=UPI002810D035|nr:hypothetical protein [Jannaschia sp. LMIT008]